MRVGLEPVNRFCRGCGVAQGAKSRYRGFWVRVLAPTLDWAIVFLPLAIISVLGLRHGTGITTTTTHVYGSNGFSATNHNVQAGFYLRGPADVFTLFVFWIYSAWFESSARQATLGKQLCGASTTSCPTRPSAARADAAITEGVPARGVSGLTAWGTHRPCRPGCQHRRRRWTGTRTSPPTTATIASLWSS
jgi:hypothetical protein